MKLKSDLNYIQLFSYKQAERLDIKMFRVIYISIMFAMYHHHYTV